MSYNKPKILWYASMETSGHTDYHKYYILACITVYRVVCEILAFHNIAGEVFFLLGYGTMSLGDFLSSVVRQHSGLRTWSMNHPVVRCHLPEEQKSHIR